MRHGPGDSIRAEPNLVPLLDLVLQLLMFFILTVHFVTQQVSEDIQLPVMQSARPMPKGDTDVLYLNLNARGWLEVPGRAAMKNPGEMRVYLRGEYDDAQRISRTRGAAGRVETVIIIRADQAVEYRDVYRLLDTCKTIGYHRFQVRAMTEGPRSRQTGVPAL